MQKNDAMEDDEDAVHEEKITMKEGILLGMTNDAQRKGKKAEREDDKGKQRF